MSYKKYGILSLCLNYKKPEFQSSVTVKTVYLSQKKKIIISISVFNLI